MQTSPEGVRVGNGQTPTNGKAFVVTLSKAKLDVEISAAEILRNAPEQLKVENLLRSPGVRLSKNSAFLDFRNMPEFMKAVFTLVGASVVSSIDLGRVNLERISVIRQLSALGYAIAVPDYGISSENILQRVREYSKVFKARSPVTGTLGTTKEYPSSLLWARDLWQKLEGKRVMRFRPNGMNNAGEGGLIVPVNNRNFIVSEVLKNNPTILELEKMGHRFYFMKDGMQFNPNLSKVFSINVYNTIDHVDLFVGIAGNMMLIQESYFIGQNKTLLGKAAKDNKLQILFVPHEEERLHPSNFLVLDRNKILMNKGAEKTIALLRTNGVDVVPTTVPMQANLRFGGSIRCFVNEL